MHASAVTMLPDACDVDDGDIAFDEEPCAPSPGAVDWIGLSDDLG